jgi:hypothetical protein
MAEGYLQLRTQLLALICIQQYVQLVSPWHYGHIIYIFKHYTQISTLRIQSIDSAYK